MPRPFSFLFIALITFVGVLTVDSSTADAQLFRRLQARRQVVPPTPQPNSGQSNSARANYPGRNNRNPGSQQPQDAAQRSGDGPNRAAVGTGKTANYSRVPTPIGPAVFSPADEDSAPTLAKTPQPVSDDSSSDSDNKSSKSGDMKLGDLTRSALTRSALTRSDGAVAKKTASNFGQSILTRGRTETESAEEGKGRFDDDAERSKAAKTNNLKAEAGKSKSATMGLEVYQQSQPQDGVRVARIRDDSLADESGLKVGDMIVAIDRNRTRSVQQVAALMGARQPGQIVQVQFVRAGMAYITDVPLVESKVAARDSGSEGALLAKSPEIEKNSMVTAAKPAAPENDVSVSGKNGAGRDVDEPSAKQIKLGMMVDNPRSLRGTVVTSVREGSIAEASGLQKGDRIVSVDGQLLSGGDGLRAIVRQRELGDKLAMGIVRRGQLISRKVELIDQSANDIGKSEPTADDTAASKIGGEANQTVSTGLAKGIGAMIGGLFASDTSSPNELKPAASKPGTTQPVAAAVTKAAGRSSAAEDPLAFGDDEPIEQVIFQKRMESTVEAKSPDVAVMDPPSLKTLKIPAGKIAELKEQDSLSKAEAKKLRSQIERLEAELRVIEGFDSE